MKCDGRSVSTPDRFVSNSVLVCRCSVVIALSLFAFRSARASGEINFVRAPVEIAAGDDITIIVSASAREKHIDRTLALEYPANWKFKRAWRVEAGSEHIDKIAPYSEVRALLAPEPGQATIALADYTPNFDPHAAGIGYFVVFSTAKEAEKATVKAALVERVSPDAPPEIDPQTKRPIQHEHNWRMVFPTQRDFSFSSIVSKRLSAMADVVHVPWMERSLVVDGGRNAYAPMSIRPELFEEYFRHPFSIQFWFRTTSADETILNLSTPNGRGIRIGVGLLGQPMVTEEGKERKTILASHAITNDGAWHYLVISNDSLGALRMFVDAELSGVVHQRAAAFAGITAATIGDSTNANKDFSIDELRFVHGAFRDAAEFENKMIVAQADSFFRPFALFHFDDFSWRAVSPVPETAPIYFTLDSAAAIRETSSPVQSEPVSLLAEMPSPTSVHLRWSRTSELGIKEYELELRVGTYGSFETFSSVPARHGSKALQRGEPIVSWEAYNATEELPQLNRNIDLYFRVAALGYTKKDQPQYSLPMKIEYSTDRDMFVEQNDPEPFHDTTQIAFSLTKPETVRLSVFDMIGREIATLVNAHLDPGRHSYALDAASWPQGIYFYKLTTSRATITRKMTLLK